MNITIFPKLPPSNRYAILEQVPATQSYPDAVSYNGMLTACVTKLEGTITGWGVSPPKNVTITYANCVCAHVPYQAHITPPPKSLRPNT